MNVWVAPVDQPGDARPMTAEKTRPDSGVDYFRVAEGRVEEKPFTSVDYEDAASTSPLGFTVDRRTLY